MERKTADDYPQELLDLFHEYQHGDIDRRSFLSGIARFAVGGLTVAAIFESLTPNYAWAQTVPKDDKDLKTGYETVPSPQGNGSIKGYLARPAKGKKFPVRACHSRKSRAQSIYRGCGTAAGKGRLHGVCPGRIDLGRRLSGR